MDGLLSFLCLLCVLITPGHSLSCITCKGVNSCMGSSSTCMPNYSCGLTYREATEGGNITTEYMQSCVLNTKCNKMGSISYSGGTMKIGFSCCNTDNCTPPLPQWPATSSQDNGLVCPSCLSQYSCFQETNIQCTGSEQNCIYQSSSSETVMGCATSALCDVEDFANDFETMQFLCFPGTSSSITVTACVVCASMNSKTCSSSLSVAPENAKCATAYLIITTNGTSSYQVNRSWAPVNKCNMAGSITATGYKFLMGISCCDGNGCTPSLPDPTSTSGVSNGAQCKTCDSIGTTSCEANTNTKCTGEETECVDYTWKTALGTSCTRGCGTKSLCDAANLSSSMNDMNFVNTFTCNTIIPTTTTLSNGGSSTTSNGGNGPTSNGGTDTTSNGENNTTSNGGNGTTSNGGSGTTSNGGSGTTSNGGSGTTSNGGSGTTINGGSSTTIIGRCAVISNGGNSITAPSNEGVIFLLFSTLAAILILHQFNKDP